MSVLSPDVENSSSTFSNYQNTKGKTRISWIRLKLLNSIQVGGNVDM